MEFRTVRLEKFTSCGLLVRFPLNRSMKAIPIPVNLGSLMLLR